MVSVKRNIQTGSAIDMDQPNLLKIITNMQLYAALLTGISIYVSFTFSHFIYILRRKHIEFCFE
jgi:hypothetical protein